MLLDKRLQAGGVIRVLRPTLAAVIAGRTTVRATTALQERPAATHREWGPAPANPITRLHRLAMRRVSNSVLDESGNTDFQSAAVQRLANT